MGKPLFQAVAEKIVLDWNEGRNWHVDLKHDELIDTITDALRRVRTETRREAFEEAARVCESLVETLGLTDQPRFDGDNGLSMKHTALGLAVVIRKLAEKEAKG